MNRIITALLIVLVSGCASQQLGSTSVSKPTQMTAEASKFDSKSSQSVGINQAPTQQQPLISNRSSFWHHKKPPVETKQHAANEEQSEDFLPRIARYIKQGLASWYGPKFHGRKTATGELFDMYGMTAAHKTLPIPSYAKVTNLQNNKSVVVRINDRGPFVGDRLLDLSYAAAKELDIDKKGIGKVEIVALSEKQAIPQMEKLGPRNDKNLYLQVGTFKNPKKAQKLQHKISAHQLANAEIRSSTYKKSTLYKVQIGPFKSQSGAIQLAQKLSEIGISKTQFVTASNNL